MRLAGWGFPAGISMRSILPIARVARSELAFGNFNSAVAFTGPDFGDHLIRHVRRFLTAHDQADDAGAQTNASPLAVQSA